ncbi:Small ubiquitin-related modifier 3 [Amphibalanus amphitrite]|uniref:Small ubiquitin-related modifier n=1 Tax=Amphibalanus amphitrite TaxID=1232801 RepID=A0A6A4W1K4_AMPAM|nr:small ubiquitin-related modifier 3-like [Amphibalanus amphitrite]XP_043229541.1 small ubiquitin-related modifier 3-like [Amphibalanus amphitrite]XP_043229542.1 small ubiquitin-related modifier 3-like [Amphibalanus amphitrite]KAF0300315.1 Small ubiquitin-related modifier 3 [Amphibalanus amphitrite]
MAETGGGDPKEEKNKDAPGGDEHINLKVMGQDGSSVFFKIKRHTPFRKLMTAYCNRVNMSLHAVRFRFDGEPVREVDTPQTMSMEDGDAIEVFQQQTGGRRRPPTGSGS